MVASSLLGTKNVTLDEEYCRIHVEAKPGEYVLLSVSDTGHGMDKATIEHIFEPFYTTKGIGKRHWAWAGYGIWNCEAAWRTHHLLQ